MTTPISSNPPPLAPASHSPSSLRGIGNKAQKLEELQNSLVHAKVPPFVAISDAEVRSFLSKKMPQIERLWHEFCRLQETHPTLSEEGKKVLHEIRVVIEEAFERETHPFKALRPFLARQGREAEFMVRSSSQEDGGEAGSSPNAGGNLSLPCTANPTLLASSIGAVIASYFSEQSLGLRLAYKERVTGALPLLSFFVQELIGESRDEVPLSAVLFLPESGMQMTSVAHVQVALGHGEGLVAKKTAYDSLHLNLDTEEVMSQTLAVKPTRLRRGKDSQLEEVENPAHLATSPCLNGALLHKLMALAQELKAKYPGRKLDTEIVIKGGEIYLVQVRDQVVREGVRPSYIDMTLLSSEELAAKEAVTLVDEGRGEALLFRHPEDVLVGKTLEEALTRFCALPEAQQLAVKAVFIEEMAAANSHWATLFRARSLPILTLPFPQKLEKTLAENQQVYLDVQQESLVFSNKPPEELIKIGRLSFPIAREQSLALGYSPTLETTVLRALHREEGAPSLSAREIKALRIPQALRELGLEGRAEAKIHTIDLLLRKFLRQKQILPRPLLWKILETLASMKEQLYSLAEAPSLEGRAEIHKHFLLSKRVLESLIFQEGSSRLLSASSVKTFYTDQNIYNEALEAWGREEGEMPLTFAQFYPLRKMLLSEDQQNHYLDFLRRLDEPQAARFQRNLLILEKTGALPYLLSQLFATPLTSVEATLTRLEKEREELAKVTESLKAFDEITSWGSRLHEWKDPAQFEALSSAWEREMRKVFASGFAPIMDPEKGVNLSPTGKQVLSSKLSRLVDLFDRIIKTQATSPDHPEKICERQKLLLLYNELLLNIFFCLSPKVRNAVAPYTEEYGSLQKTSLPHYAEKIRADLGSRKLDSSQLTPSSGFDVSGAVIGSGATLVRQYPKEPTLEDLFTLMHQNMIQAISLATEVPQALPDCLRGLPAEIAAVKGKISFIDTTEFPLVKIRINIPQRNHSSFVDITYDAIKKRMTFELHLVGEERDHRLATSIANLLVEGLNRGATPSHIPNTLRSFSAPPYTGLEVAWEVDAAKVPAFLTIFSAFKNQIDLMSSRSHYTPQVASFTSEAALETFQSPAWEKGREFVIRYAIRAAPLFYEKLLARKVEFKKKTDRLLEGLQLVHPELIPKVRPLIEQSFSAAHNPVHVLVSRLKKEGLFLPCLEGLASVEKGWDVLLDWNYGSKTWIPPRNEWWFNQQWGPHLNSKDSPSLLAGIELPPDFNCTGLSRLLLEQPEPSLNKEPFRRKLIEELMPLLQRESSDIPEITQEEQEAVAETLLFYRGAECWNRIGSLSEPAQELISNLLRNNHFSQEREVAMLEDIKESALDRWTGHSFLMPLVRHLKAKAKALDEYQGEAYDHSRRDASRTVLNLLEHLDKFGISRSLLR